MNKAMLLSATAVMAVLSGGAPVTAKPVHKPTTALWYQNSNFGAGIISQNYTSGTYSSYNQAAADDFIVPAGKTWKVKEVDVSGMYLNGSGPAKSEDVTFYRNSRGFPGTAVKGGTFTDLSCAESSGSFTCTLPKKLRLTKGHYWVSLVANCGLTDGCGEWGWVTNTVVHEDGAALRPAGGSWARISPQTDLAFTLRGKP